MVVGLVKQNKPNVMHVRVWVGMKPIRSKHNREAYESKVRA